MTDGDIQNQLNQISSDLIQVHVSDIFKRLNISRNTELSDEEKSQLKKSVEGLKSQTEAFLADQQNSEKTMTVQTEALIEKLQKIKRNKNNSES
ncbi:hypothetical protein [Paraliobacillus sediminis]|uniref:hypothetical protein n=1 Tax=Paraliobacillus sediminis TaxID=1885916 RepID=UPI000E3C5B4D|nr:hypothetical protein [Paraliobacillus sediminis]